MAQLTSLGIHTPVALPYLISEGLLPPSAGPEDYQWKTYVSSDKRGPIEEEVLVTKNCVVWSQGAFVRNVYRFDLEKDEISQALLANFADDIQSNSATHAPVTAHGSSLNSTGRSPVSQNDPAKSAEQHDVEGELNLSRALVVFLKNKAHIYFLHGTSHIVDLPFEVERAFVAPKGLVIQRKASPLPSLPPTPVLPSAPPNSFFHPQIQPTSSMLQSPSVVKSFPSTQADRPSPRGMMSKVDEMFQDLLGGPVEEVDDNLAGLYSLTSPLSDVGVISYSIQQQKPRLTPRTQTSLSIVFEPLDATEEVVYVSPNDELGWSKDQSREPLTFIVTMNRDTSTLTIWHAWYLSEKSLSTLLKQRAAAKSAKARRRSSFVSAGMGTGATTPAVRTREAGARESLAGAGSVRLLGESAVISQPPAGISTRRKTRQEEEEAMASQMDPDYQPSNSQQAAAARESRRISSLNADTRASQHPAGGFFAGAVGRRNASFGGFNERRSLGHRKSRGSTPGSILSRSLGADDDLMDLDASTDDDETVESIMSHIRATFEAGGAEDLLGATDDSFKRDIVVRKLQSFPIQSPGSLPTQNAMQVYTLGTSRLANDHGSGKLDIYLREGPNVRCLHVLVRSRPLFAGLPASHSIPIPIVVGERKHNSVSDIVKLHDHATQAILLADRGIVISPHAEKICPLPDAPKYRRHGPFERIQDDKMYVDVGRNRTLRRPPRDSVRLTNTGVNGRYEEVAEDGSHHRLQLRLRPTDRLIGILLEACELVLPSVPSKTFTGTWSLACGWLQREPQRLVGTAESAERLAFVATILTFAMPLVDAKTRAAIRLSTMATAPPRGTARNSVRQAHQIKELSRRSAWSRILDQLPTDRTNDFDHQTERLPTPLKNDQLIVAAAALAEEMLKVELSQPLPQLNTNEIAKIMLALHILSEDRKLCILANDSKAEFLAPLIMQLGSCLGSPSWNHGSCPYYDLQCDARWAIVKSTPQQQLQMSFMDAPVGVYHWFEHALNVSSSERYPTLDLIAGLDSDIAISKELQNIARRITPRLALLSDIVSSTNGLTASAIETVELMSQSGLTIDMMETLPEAIAAPLKEAIGRCEKDPPTTWSHRLLLLVGRDDLTAREEHAVTTSNSSLNALPSPHDVQTICHALDHQHHAARTKEANRHAVSQLIFHEDRRLVEATSLMHFNSAQVAECPKQPDWTDAQHLEQQRRVMQYVMTRMIALPAGDAMLHFDSQNIMLTDKYHLTGFSNSCIMQPMGHTHTADRSGLTEEKVNWAYFHAGASAGLRISRHVEGIDTSWVAFNKPVELTNRHAGLLLALGLSGHLRQLAKWLSFKYLTPKHSMTSVGLLLGLSASYMGSMDSLITRMLSVHITRMLPPGAAELNVSPITQTAGLVGIGLLYYNTQHRRMSEVMLSEIEHMELEDPDAGPDPLRDESYRLAAGIALGLINLGKGKDLYGLHGMYLPERLLAVAVGPRPVSAVHVFDKATAGAVIAMALVYMKSGDESVARKINIPDTEAQFDHVRPDMLMLRTMAKHLILWDSIEAKVSMPGVPSWIQSNLPGCYRNRFEDIRASAGRHPLKSPDVPFFNIATGLALALSLKYAGSGNTDARDEILIILDYFYMVKGGAEAHYYDAKLTRSTVRRCIDALALAVATVMAGTGDVRTFRYLRRLHGRTDVETPYGSHFASHLAIGALFLGGGTLTFGTSDLAIAALIVAFYPLYPTDVHDNHVHLQALRHLWVFAVEARCLVVEETDTKRPISMPITVTFRDGSTKSMTAPCLLPELDTIATAHTNNPAYWRATLDFQNNPKHLIAFRQNQRIFVRRCPASEAHTSIFSATLTSLNDQLPVSLYSQHIWQSVLKLDAFKELDKSSVELILPPDVHSAVSNDEHGTVVDDQLVLTKAVNARNQDELWNLRMLFAWADKARKNDGQLRWIGAEVVETLKAKIEERMRQTA